MRKYLMCAFAVAVLGGATPALAADSGGVISMHEALDVAASMGLVTVSDSEFSGDEWEIEGRDMAGRYMEVDVDAATGQVLSVDR